MSKLLQLSVLLFTVLLCKGCNIQSGDVCNLNANGEEVVNAVISLIESTKIFDCDHFFMRRLAYVQTEYGANVPQSYFGIWGLKYKHISIIPALSSNKTLRDVAQLIDDIFDINVFSIDTKQLEIPLISGIVTRFYLLVLNVIDNNITIPMSISQQAELWYQINFNKKNKDQQYFIDRVTVLEEQEGNILHSTINCKVTMSYVCVKRCM